MARKNLQALTLFALALAGCASPPASSAPGSLVADAPAASYHTLAVKGSSPTPKPMGCSTKRPWSCPRPSRERCLAAACHGTFLTPGSPGGFALQLDAHRHANGTVDGRLHVVQAAAGENPPTDFRVSALVLQANTLDVTAVATAPGATLSLVLHARRYDKAFVILRLEERNPSGTFATFDGTGLAISVAQGDCD